LDSDESRFDLNSDGLGLGSGVADSGNELVSDERRFDLDSNAEDARLGLVSRSDVGRSNDALDSDENRFDLNSDGLGSGSGVADRGRKSDLEGRRFDLDANADDARMGLDSRSDVGRSKDALDYDEKRVCLKRDG